MSLEQVNAKLRTPFAPLEDRLAAADHRCRHSNEAMLIGGMGVPSHCYDILLPGQLPHHAPPAADYQVRTLNEQLWSQEWKRNKGALLEHRDALSRVEIAENDPMDLFNLAALHGKGKRKAWERELKRNGTDRHTVTVTEGKKQHLRCLQKFHELFEYYRETSTFSGDVWKNPHADRYAFGSSQRTFLAAGAPRGEETACGTVLQADPTMQSPTLHIACFQGNFGLAQQAVEAVTKGIGDPQDLRRKAQEELNKANAIGDTALHVVCDVPGTQSIAELLVANGADITVRTGEGDSCLHRAIQARNVPTALFLIAKKVDVNAQNNARHTPLHIAAANGDVESVKVLLGAKAAPFPRDIGGHTPLFAAASRGRVGTAQVLIEARAAVNRHDKDGNTVLHYAAGNGDVPLATYLLTAHANMSLRNHRKEAPIDVAFRNGQLKTLEWVFGKSTWQPAKRDSMAPSKRVPLGGANLGRDFRIRGPLRQKVEDRGIVPPPDLPPGMKTHDLRVWPVLAAKAHIHAHGILTEDEEREQQNAAATKNTGNSDEWDWPEEEEEAAEPVKEREAFDGLRGEHWRMMGNPN